MVLPQPVVGGVSAKSVVSCRRRVGAVGALVGVFDGVTLALRQSTHRHCGDIDQ
jgi:hypothetical protein